MKNSVYSKCAEGLSSLVKVKEEHADCRLPTGRECGDRQKLLLLYQMTSNMFLAFLVYCLLFDFLIVAKARGLKASCCCLLQQLTVDS
jgi:hypothetical protein